MRIIKRAAGTKHPAQGFLYFPGALVNRQKGREYTLGTRYGTNVEWIKFVFEYVRYAVSKFDTYMDARAWFENERKRFFKGVQALWAHRGGNDVPAARFWEIKRSTLPEDPEYTKKGWFPPGGPGFGVWCTKTGSHTIWYDGPPFVTVTKSDTPTELEARFLAKYIDSDKYVVPTPESFSSKAIHYSFIVNHKRDQFNPTHEPCCMDDGSGTVRPCLKPLRVAKAGEEFCFDYKLDSAEYQPTVEDHDTALNLTRLRDLL